MGFGGAGEESAAGRKRGVSKIALEIILLRGKLRQKGLMQPIWDRAVGRTSGSIQGWSIRMHSLAWVLVGHRC